MTRKERYDFAIRYFRKEMPEVQTELEFGRFRHFPDAKSMAKAEVDDVLEYVKSVSYPNSKADHLVKMARQLVEHHGGEVPEDMNLLLDLPGVGRKTANVIQSVAFGKSTMAVDTHVFRVSHRLGLVSKKDDTPYKVEQVLVKNIPMEDIPLVIASWALHLYFTSPPLRKMRFGQRLPLCHPFIILRWKRFSALMQSYTFEAGITCIIFL